MTNDAKIQDVALAYIGKNAHMRPSWPCTTVGALHPSIGGRFSLENGELVLVSAFFSDESWYSFTTRRIVSQFRGAFQSLEPSHGIEEHFGNFKGLPRVNADPLENPVEVRREIARIAAKQSGAVVQFEFETGEASMLPIYAARYWVVKHQALSKLMTSAEREEYKRKRVPNAPSRQT